MSSSLVVHNKDDSTPNKTLYQDDDSDSDSETDVILEKGNDMTDVIERYPDSTQKNQEDLRWGVMIFLGAFWLFLIGFIFSFKVLGNPHVHNMDSTLFTRLLQFYREETMSYLIYGSIAFIGMITLLWISFKSDGVHVRKTVGEMWGVGVPGFVWLLIAMGLFFYRDRVDLNETSHKVALGVFVSGGLLLFILRFVFLKDEIKEITKDTTFIKVTKNVLDEKDKNIQACFVFLCLAVAVIVVSMVGYFSTPYMKEAGTQESLKIISQFTLFGGLIVGSICFGILIRSNTTIFLGDNHKNYQDALYGVCVTFFIFLSLSNALLFVKDQYRPVYYFVIVITNILFVACMYLINHVISLSGIRGKYFQINTNTSGDNKKGTTTILPTSISKTFGDDPFDLSPFFQVTGSHGKKTFSSGDSNIISINGSTATINTPGSTTITLKVDGTSDFEAGEASTSVSISKAQLDVTSTSSSITLPTLTLDVSTLFTITSKGTPVIIDGGKKTYSCINRLVTFSGTTATFPSSSQIEVYTITLTIQDTEYYFGTASSTTVTVNPSGGGGKTTPQITATNINKTFGDQPFDLSTFFTVTGSDGVKTYTSDNPNIVSVSGSTATIVGAGNTIVRLSVAETSTTNAAISQSTASITKGTLSITASPITKTTSDPPFDVSSLFTITPSSATIPESAKTYTSSNTTVLTISGNTATVVGSTGTSNVTLTIGETQNYLMSTSPPAQVTILQSGGGGGGGGNGGFITVDPNTLYTDPQVNGLLNPQLITPSPQNNLYPVYSNRDVYFLCTTASGQSQGLTADNPYTRATGGYTLSLQPSVSGSMCLVSLTPPSSGASQTSLQYLVFQWLVKYMMNSCAFGSQQSCVVIDQALSCILPPSDSLTNKTADYLNGWLCAIINGIYNVTQIPSTYNPYTTGTPSAQNWQQGVQEAQQNSLFLKQIYRPQFRVTPFTVQIPSSSPLSFPLSSSGVNQALMYLRIDLVTSSLGVRDTFTISIGNTPIFVLSRCKQVSYTLQYLTGETAQQLPPPYFNGVFQSTPQVVTVEFFHILKPANNSGSQSYKMINIQTKNTVGVVQTTQTCRYTSDIPLYGNNLECVYGRGAVSGCSEKASSSGSVTITGVQVDPFLGHYLTVSYQGEPYRMPWFCTLGDTYSGIFSNTQTTQLTLSGSQTVSLFATDPSKPIVLPPFQGQFPPENVFFKMDTGSGKTFSVQIDVSSLNQNVVNIGCTQYNQQNMTSGQQVTMDMRFLRCSRTTSLLGNSASQVSLSSSNTLTLSVTFGQVSGSSRSYTVTLTQGSTQVASTTSTVASSLPIQLIPCMTWEATGSNSSQAIVSQWVWT